MAKYHGYIGFAITEETSPGVWKERIVEKEYSGDINRIRRNWNLGQTVNENLDISNEISIIANPFAEENAPFMKYLTWMGHYWRITSISIEYPRMILTIGGLYDGKKPTRTA